MTFSSTVSGSLLLLYVMAPLVNMRQQPTDDAVIESQCLFSEPLHRHATVDNWSLVSTPDGTRGWIPAESYIIRETVYETSIEVNRLAAHLYRDPNLFAGAFLTLPFRSKLQLIDDTNERWLKVALPDGTPCYIQRGDVATENSLKAAGIEGLASLSQQFIDLPYTWGGRSSFGYDCSGFVQMLFAHIGVELPRKSKHQFLDPQLMSIPIDQIQLGDLIFWGKSIEKITHVAMALSKESFIHSSLSEAKPWLRISHLTDPEWAGTPHSTRPFRIAKRLILKPVDKDARK